VAAHVDIIDHHSHLVASHLLLGAVLVVVGVGVARARVVPPHERH